MVTAMVIIMSVSLSSLKRRHLMLGIGYFKKIKLEPWGKTYKVINAHKDLIQCKCGKCISLNSIASHSTVCADAKEYLYEQFHKLAVSRANGNQVDGLLVHYWPSKEICDAKHEQYWRINKKLRGRKKCAYCDLLIHSKSAFLRLNLSF